MSVASRLRQVESRAAANRPDFGVSTLEHIDEGYRLTVDLYGHGTNRTLISTHPTETAAKAEFSRLIEKYKPPKPDPVLLILYRSTEESNGKS